MSYRPNAWMFAAMLTAAAAGLQAQSSAEINGGLEFSFGSPGARSLARGGAFAGLADDATAAYTNPAGLTNILKPELSIEARGASYTNNFTDSGHAFGPPSHLGFDQTPGIHEGSLVDRRASVSFLSFVLPYDRWSVAIHRHELMNFRASAKSQGIYFDVLPPAGQPVPYRLFPADSSLDLSIVSYGATFAYRLRENLSLGVSIVRQQFNLSSLTTRFEADFHARSANTQPIAVLRQSGKDTSLAFTTGLLWRMSPGIQVGAVYQQGSQFDAGIDERIVNTPAAPQKHGKFNVPSVYRAGASLGLDSYTTLSVEADYIRYSVLTRGFLVLGTEPPNYTVNDGTEIHLGVERMLVADWLLRATRYPVIVAAGAWRDPDHRIRYVNPDPTDPRSIAQSLLFRAGSSQWHGSAGAGLSVGRSYTVNVAYDYSHRQRTLSLSAVTRF